jgi:hypothetical protein
VGCAERAHVAGEVDDASARGVHVEHGGVHASTLQTQPIATPRREEEPN